MNEQKTLNQMYMENLINGTLKLETQIEKNLADKIIQGRNTATGIANKLRQVKTDLVRLETEFSKTEGRLTAYLEMLVEQREKRINSEKTGGNHESEKREPRTGSQEPAGEPEEVETLSAPD